MERVIICGSHWTAPALLRRFDLTSLLPPPSESAILHYLERYEATRGIHFPLPVAVLAHDLAGHAWSTVERTCQQLHKQEILHTLHSDKERWP